MALQCNIDSRGKAIRLAYGLALFIVGAALLVVGTVRGAGVWWGVIAAALAGGGGFAVFEARSGWCVLRAMGIKTRF